MAPTTLALCAGYAGLEIAVKSVYPRSRVVGYVEWEAFSAAVLMARMEDESLERAPIWCGDLAKLPTAPFLGVDLITAGFSCQPWSSAGLGLGTADERWIWPDIIGLASRVGCRALFLENVPPLIVRGGLELVLGDLASLGFDAEWTVLRASDVGAPHQRERVFILAYARGARRPEITGSASRDESEYAGWSTVEGDEPGGPIEDVADSNGDRLAIKRSGRVFDGERTARWRDSDGCGITTLAYSDSQGRQGKGRAGTTGRRELAIARSVFPPRPDDRDEWESQPPGAQPSLRRELDGSAYWLGTTHASIDDQLRTLGNGVVWQQAAAALRILDERMRSAA